MKPQRSAPCKRPYSLGKRRERSDDKRATILAAVRAQLESNGFLSLTLDALARESGVTRQTIHNLFGTKAGMLEALFDELALEGGMERMRFTMQQSDPETMLASFVEVFCGFWKKERVLIRRVHGIAAIEPEFGAAVAARNQRRRMAAERVIQQLDKRSDGRDAGGSAERSTERSATLYALTSFEFFDALAEGCRSAEEAARLLLELVRVALLRREPSGGERRW